MELFTLTGSIAHSGAWGIALIVIVMVSWGFYKFFVPKSWQEWVGAGLVQAFIIALYAEMYGFPLTIYLLVRFFGLDREYVSANLWSTLFSMGETGMLISMILGYAVAFIGLGLFVSGWRPIHRARQDEQLVTDGLYAYVRHPQYTGLFLALFGEGIIHWPTLFSVGLFPFIVLTFTWLARREERKMLDQFGEDYRTYRYRTPMFVPDWGQWHRFAGTLLTDRDHPSGDRAEIP